MLELRPILSAMLQHKTRAVLVILQMALTLAIVSNAVFIIDERIALMNRETGYPAGEIFGFRGVNIDSSVDMTTQIEVDEDILRAIPGVIDAVVINHIPIVGSGSTSSWSLEQKEGIGEFPSGVFRGDEHVLTTMGVELIEGRNFTPEEVSSHQEVSDSLVILSKSLADKLFPDGQAVGKTIYRHGNPSKVVGVVKKMQGMWVSWSAFEDNVIFPSNGARSFVRYMVRTEPERRAEVMAQVEEKLLASFPERVINSIDTMEHNIANSYRSDNGMKMILTVIISFLLAVTVIGIFGLSSFSVNQRTKQIGTRRALGATKFAIARYFLVENALMASMGIAIGVILAFALNYVLVNEYGVSKLNNGYVLGTMFAILTVSLASVLVPALRAANISPALATR